MPRFVSAAEREAIRADVDNRGFAVVSDYLTPKELDDVSIAIRALQDTAPFGSSRFAGWRTKRVFNLVAKTRALDGLLTDQLVLEIAKAVLGPKIQLSIASTMEIFPEEMEQPLHQDDYFYSWPNPHPPLVFNTMWALTDFNAINGATRVVPESHHLAEMPDVAARCDRAVMKAGSVLIWNGAVWHGGGANMSASPRLGLSINYCRACLRQQENQYLAVPLEVALREPEISKLLGYNTVDILGLVDGLHPMEWLKQYDER